MTKIESRSSIYHHRHFTEHLLGAVEERFEPRILEFFDPVTLRTQPASPATIESQSETVKKPSLLKKLQQS
jgi:hypothetical protein